MRLTKAPVIRPKGERYPGSGRVKGTPNRVSVEARVLVGELVNDPEYQTRLRRDFALRRLHPTIESMVWAYCIGKPRQDIQLSGAIDVNARLEAEKRVFLQLDIADLEVLAAESEALMDRAIALAALRNGGESGDVGRTGAELLRISSGSDNLSSVNQPIDPPETAITPADTEVNTLRDDGPSDESEST